jgi:hypothetical protein
MANIFGLNKWQLDKAVSNTKRQVGVKIILKYPDQKQFINFKPRQRIKKIDEDFQHNFNNLISLELFEGYEVIGTKKRPRGVKVMISFDVLTKLKNIDSIDSLWVESVENATYNEKNERPSELFFCVKMTIVIEVEGISWKKQDIEQRFVLIKAKSSEDAYEKVEKQKDIYAEPYLNSDGRFVRFRVESFDDCFDTGISNLKDLETPEGIEVYSKLKSRKAKTKTIWDGRS